MIQFLVLIALVILSIGIGVLVIRSNPKSYTNKVYSTLIFFTIIWISSNYIGDHFPYFLGPRVTLDIINVSSSTVLWLLYILSNVFPQKTVNENKKYFILSFLSLIALATLLSATNFITKEAIPLPQGLSVVFGNGALLFIGYFVVLILLSLFNLFIKYKHASGIQKQQLQYLALGFGLTAGISLITNLVLPIFGIFGPSVYGSYSLIILLSLTAYSIIRHQLFEISSIIARGFVYFLLISFVSATFVGSTVIVGTLLQDNLGNSIFIGIVVSLVVVFGLDPLKKFLNRISDRFFFKASINYSDVLKILSESVSYQLDLEPLIRELRKTLREELKLKFVATLLRKTNNGSTEEFVALDDMLNMNHELRLSNASALISYLRSHRHPAVLDSLERKIDDTPEAERPLLEKSKAEFERMGAALVSPIYAQDHLIAVLVLGPKLSGDTFSGEDLNLIEVLSPQIGSAIQKANLYEEVKQFSEGLKAKVDAATSELRERNTSLQTLQHITKEITRTLDFNQVVQQIADSVSTELGYLGAILVFLDDDGRTVRARAITQTSLTKKAMDMLPVKFTDYTTDLSDPSSTSIGHQVLRSGHTMVTASFAQVISPPIPKLLAQGIQKLLGMKTMVVVPINSEGKTIGCIEIGLQQRQEDISKQEFDTMSALADELGVVYRNIKLFDRIQTTNQQLEVANAHLQQLDQAKSEFVSIASHQLRTPMTGIMGYLSMMTSGDFGKIAPEHQKILVSLLAESQRMIRLINQFLNVSKIEAGKFTYTKKPTQLLDLAKTEVQELLHVAKDKKLELRTEFADRPLPETQADPDKIQDVMLNLIDNAIKYTASGSITVGLDMKGPDIHFYVRDTGIGISPNDAKELFNKFVRGSGIAQIHPDGSGLGLFIAKSIIDSHDGKIWVESEGEGKGSTFQFTIPVVHTDPGKEQH